MKGKVSAVQVADVSVGGDAPLAVIAGPCVAESRDLCLRVAEGARAVCGRLGLGYIFKASYDKANRSSVKSYRGPGQDAQTRL
jgi:2-dehydro-3-deoxyphosphooctonate aldolase (KDO 8-P synthase)